jgi:hypothetical protein
LLGSTNDDYVGRLDACRRIPPQTGYEIVFGFVDRLAVAECLEMGAEQERMMPDCATPDGER